MQRIGELKTTKKHKRKVRARSQLLDPESCALCQWAVRVGRLSIQDKL